MKFGRELVPYLLQSVYDWCCDNGLRTMLLVRGGGRSVLPRQHVQDGFIIFDISNAAVRGLDFGADSVSFEASFNGRPFAVEVANEDVVGIGSPERGIGLAVPAGGVMKKANPDRPAAKGKKRASSGSKKGANTPELKLI